VHHIIFMIHSFLKELVNDFLKRTLYAIKAIVSYQKRGMKNLSLKL
jgi:hypothetical protein